MKSVFITVLKCYFRQYTLQLLYLMWLPFMQNPKHYSSHIIALANSVEKHIILFFCFSSQTTAMRRNLASLIKFTLFCAFAVLLTILLYKTFSVVQPKHFDKSSHREASPLIYQGSFFSAERNVKRVKIDWNDYKYIEGEKLREGIGEHGVAASLPTDLETERKELFDQNGFNALLSDKIALNRSVKDIRHKE